VRWPYLGFNPTTSSIAAFTNWTEEGAPSDDCSYTATVPQGQHYVKLILVETFYIWTVDGHCTLFPSDCTETQTMTLTSGTTTLDTSSVSGNGGVGPDADAGPSWTEIAANVYQRTVIKLVDVSGLTASGSATLNWEITIAQGTYDGPIGTSLSLVPAGSQLQSFTWSYPSGGAAALELMYQDQDPAAAAVGSWYSDLLADEGSYLVTSPQWVSDTSGDGSAQRNDPAAYLSGSNPAITNVNLTRPDGFTGSAVLRITEAASLLVFPDTTVTFSSGTASYSYAITSTQALPSNIANLTPLLTWSLSIDGGSTFLPFAWTGH
jgi:hypothetical protein